MAEALFRKMLEQEKIAEIAVESRGIAGSPLLKVPEPVKTLLGEKGCDVSKHISQSLTHEAMEEASLILVMEEHHKLMIKRFYPEMELRTHLLKEYAGESEPLEITDPIGLSEEMYRKTASQIEDCLKKLLEKMKCSPA